MLYDLDYNRQETLPRGGRRLFREILDRLAHEAIERLDEEVGYCIDHVRMLFFSSHMRRALWKREVMVPVHSACGSSTRLAAQFMDLYLWLLLMRRRGCWIALDSWVPLNFADEQGFGADLDTYRIRFARCRLGRRGKPKLITVTDDTESRMDDSRHPIASLSIQELVLRGATPKYAKYLKSDAWLRVRRAALDRAMGYCERCAHRHRLEVHHRHYRTLGNEASGDLEALCTDCHRLADQLRADTSAETWGEILWRAIHHNL